MSAGMRQSIRSTYDSRQTGPAYHVTTRLGDRTVSFQDPIVDPFIHTAVIVGWRDALRELLRHRRLRVMVIVGGHPDRINDVLELDENTLIHNSTRKATFWSHLEERLAAFGREDEASEGGRECVVCGWHIAGHVPAEQVSDRGLAHPNCAKETGSS